jgi:hypothetical protein
MFRKLILFLITTAALACAACGEVNGLYPVQGKVLCEGKPATGATVYFHRKGDADSLKHSAPQGVVGDDGTFTLSGPQGQGALPGEYVVLVEWKQGAARSPADSVAQGPRSLRRPIPRPDPPPPASGGKGILEPSAAI